MTKFFLCGLLLLTLPLQAQPTAPSPFTPQLISELKQIQQAALQSDYAYRQVAYLSNNIGPRLTGSAQAAAAVDYVARTMEQLGLTVQREKFMAPHWVRGIETGSLVQYPGQAVGTTQKIALTALGGSVATPAVGLTAEVLVVKDFEELTRLGKAKVEGKIVLFNRPFDDEMATIGLGSEAYGQAVIYRATGPSAAARLGAVATLVRSVGGVSYRLPHTGSVRYNSDEPKIPAAAVAEEDAELLARLSSQAPVRMTLTLTPQILPDTPAYNVIADLKGSQYPDQIVIVSGHLDSWDLGTGALDDAAGVAVAMETVHLLKKLNLKPKRTIRVVAWMNEENGLGGARAYAENRKSEISNHFAAIESDLGADRPLGFSGKVSPAALALLAPVSQVLQASGAGVRRVSENAPAPDLAPLVNLGVPAFALLQDSRTYFDYHHTAADTFDKVKPRALAQNAAVMAVLAYALAQMPEPLPK